MSRHEVFVSYSSKNKEVADAIVAALESFNYGLDGDKFTVYDNSDLPSEG